jgi:hypothetical protein
MPFFVEKFNLGGFFFNLNDFNGIYFKMSVKRSSFLTYFASVVTQHCYLLFPDPGYLMFPLGSVKSLFH